MKEKLKEEVKMLKEKMYQQSSDAPFSSYHMVFPYATEDIASSLSSYQDQDKILTVMGSGDHILNYLLKGARQIDAFDINGVTKYYFELKKAMILATSYEEQLQILSNENNDSNIFWALDHLEELSPFMEEESYLFWKTYQEEIPKCDWSFVKLIINYSVSEYQKYNLYLQNKENYEKLKNILKGGIHYHFYHTEVFRLPMYLDKKEKYHEIHVSNMFQYIFPVAESVEDIGTVLSPYLEDDGDILFYGYDVYDEDFDGTKVERRKLENGDYNYYLRK